MNSYQITFISNLKYYRGRKGISQAKLAELCDCGTGTIGSIEAARQYPSFDLLYKISDVLEIHPADLFLRNTSKNEIEIRKHIENILSDGLRKVIEMEFSSQITHSPQA